MNQKEASQISHELTAENIRCVAMLDEEIRRKRTFTMKVVDSITAFCGSMAFVWIHLVWFGIWIGYDRLFPDGHSFDPYPYELLTLTVSLEAILLSTFILMSQNRDARLAERRNHLGLQIALLSEQENTKMLYLLDKIARKVGIEDDEDPSIKALEEATDPKKLAKQIDILLDKEKKDC